MLARRTLRYALARPITPLALSKAQQQRLYTDKPTDPAAPTAESVTEPATKAADSISKPDAGTAAFGSLLDSLGSKGTGRTSNQFSSLLNRDSPMKSDFAGLTGSGRFGVIGRQGEVEEDPMETLVLHVHASSNNTILSLTDSNGRVIVNASGGTVGFKKAQRAGFEPAYQATVHVANAVREKAIPVNKVELRLKGFGAGRDAVFKAVHSVTNWAVCRVVDTTPVPFNGCRPKKARRL
ncbi:hypothetical protein FBU59_000489 [Linderina macrospora]|uniref:Uncharacterized protein n=1 Tax=Linderina macrospora TaxID=4868 RepID=A0ACC1JGV4_9FUNG|nr:hypothetical protein FBU59_000489 [Linderina macrospora]